PVLVGVVLVVGLGLPLVVPGWSLDSGTVLALVIVAFVMVLMISARSAEQRRDEAEARQREADEQLAVVAERERVARDVHDILGHSLTVMTVKTELAGRLVDIDPERAKAELAELHALSRQALAEVRSTVGSLRTPDLRTELASARSALTAAQIDADLPVALDVTTARGSLFAWVLRESVTNVVRHSGASRCVVELGQDRMVVRDNGCGVPDHAFGNGLRGLTERIESAGAHLSVRGDPSGTTVEVAFDG
ncbi:MAG: sensor histidine kinase, partial [Williamsia herbipolensis]|nr:sensor histidine kinase [Williamsia herbipolensis]